MPAAGLAHGAFALPGVDGDVAAAQRCCSSASSVRAAEPPVIADRAEAVAGASKGFLRYACLRARVEGEQNLLRVLQDERRVAAGQGVMTCAWRPAGYFALTADCNHISVLDEPLMWGTLPWWTFQSPRTTRWTLGASDIIFKNEYVGGAPCLCSPQAVPLVFQSRSDARAVPRPGDIPAGARSGDREA